MAVGEEVLAVAVEEGEEEGTDVGPIHVRIRKDDDLVVPQVAHVEGLPLDPQTDSCDEVLYLVVLVHPRVVVLLHVQDLATQRQHRLRLPVPGLLGTAAGAVALDDEYLRYRGVPAAAVGQFAGQGRTLEHGLGPGKVPGPLGRLGRLCRLLGLRNHALHNLWLLLEVLPELFTDGLVHHAPHLRVAQLCLGLPLKLGVWDLHGDNRGQPLADVLPTEVRLVLLKSLCSPG
mmetsp:Transcript_7774/g.13822  ORF Transcript_7774/g.13822 Transcript_7774/m.13822 type:complete len:231 (+) Transcript_7774:508-1200(+)